MDELAVKRQTLVSIGARFEEQLEAAEAQAAQHRGAAAALMNHHDQQVQAVGAADKALDEPERSDHIPDLKTLELVKAWMTKLVNATESAARHQTNLAMTAVGAVQQAKAAHALIAKEVAKLDSQAAQAAETAKEVARLVATHPDVELDEDGDPVWLGDGAAPAGIRPGNRVERQAHEARKEPKKKATRKRKANGKSSAHA